MAFLFDGNNDYVSLPGNSALDLPNADWTMTGWLKCTSRTGSSPWHWFMYFAPGTKTILLRVPDASSPSDPDDINYSFTDDDGTNVAGASTFNPFQSNTNWTFVRIEHTGTSIKIYANGGSLTNTNASFNGITVNSALYLGGKSNNTEAFNGAMAEWAKWDRVLTADEVTALETGHYSPAFFPNSLKWYAPMIRDYIEVKAGLTITNSGSVVTDHLPMIYPAYTIIGRSAATTQNLTAPLITNTPTIYGPTATTSYSLTAPLLTNTPTFYGPTFVPGSVNLSPNLFTNTPSFYGPTLAATYSVTAPLITNTPTFYDATIAASYALTAPLLTITPTFYGPTFLPGSVSVTAPLLTNTATFPAATFLPGSVNLAPALFTNSPTFYGVNMIGPQDVTMPLLTNSSTLYGPSIRYKWVDVNNVTTGEWADGDFPFHTI